MKANAQKLLTSKKPVSAKGLVAQEPAEFTAQTVKPPKEWPKQRNAILESVSFRSVAGDSTPQYRSDSARLRVWDCGQCLSAEGIHSAQRDGVQEPRGAAVLAHVNSGAAASHSAIPLHGGLADRQEGGRCGRPAHTVCTHRHIELPDAGANAENTALTQPPA
eukprot:688386-Pyramimonas_sp.AAC.2